MAQQATKVLLQAGQDVVTIGSSPLSAAVPGWTNIAELLQLILYICFSGSSGWGLDEQ